MTARTINSPSGRQQPDFKPCRVCAHPIPKAARKCTECDSYQNRVARLTAGLNVGAFVTLIPVATLAWAFLAERVKPHASELKATIIECRNESVSVFLTNVGDRAAVLRGATFHVSVLGRDHETRVLEQSIDDPTLRVFKGGQDAIVSFRPKSIGGAAVPLVGGNVVPMNCAVIIELETVAFDHKTNPLQLSCPCPV